MIHTGVILVDPGVADGVTGSEHVRAVHWLCFALLAPLGGHGIKVA